MAGGSALIGICYTNIYLEYETLFGSPGVGPVTCLSRVGMQAMIRLPRVLQVSNCLDILCIYFTNIIEWSRAQSAPFRATPNLSRQGGQNHKNCDYTRIRRVVEPSIWVHILVCICKGIALFLHGPARPLHVSDCEHISSPFFSSLLLCSFL